MSQEERVFIVKPEGSGGEWLLFEPGDDQPQRYASQDAAVEAGKKAAQGHGPSRLEVQDADGRVASESRYDKDPLVTQLEKFGF